MPRDISRCQVCFAVTTPENRSGCYCLGCAEVCRRIAEPRGDRWPNLLPEPERSERQARVEAHARRVWEEYLSKETANAG